MSEDGPLLMTPGPTRIPERVLRAGLRVLHHRTPEFSAALSECLDRLRPLFGTASADILPVHATGRAAMEAAVLNFFRPGDAIVSCCNGKFGAMWASFAAVHGLRVIRIGSDPESIDPATVAGALDANPDARAVTVVHSDTSTGVLNPVADIARVARERDRLVLVDAISSLGGVPFRFDAWGLDFAVTSSQKCLMSSPGISFAAVGPRAWTAAERGGMPRAYLDFGAIRDTLAGERPETPGTTPVMLVLQVLEACRMIHEEGIDAVFERHDALASYTRERADSLGFGIPSPALRERSPTLSVLQAPDEVDVAALRGAMRRRGIQIAGGLGPQAGRCIRIGHMGDIRPDDVTRTMDALEISLGEARR